MNIEKIAVSGLHYTSQQYYDFIMRLSLSGTCIILLTDINNRDLKNGGEIIEKTKECNRYKIDVCDTYFIFNINQVINDNTKEEIAYAKSKGKKVMYLYDVEAINKSDEVAQVINNDDLFEALNLSSSGKLLWNASIFGRAITANAKSIVRYCAEILRYAITDELIDAAESASEEMVDYLKGMMAKRAAILQNRMKPSDNE